MKRLPCQETPEPAEIEKIMSQSATSTVMDNLELHGPGNIPISEDIFSEDIDFAQEAALAIQHIQTMFINTPLERYTATILSGFISAFSKTKRTIDKELDYSQLSLSTSIKEQDGSEVKSVELEDLTKKAQKLDEHSDVFADIISEMVREYSNITGRPWSIQYGSLPRTSARNSSAVIDAQDMIKARSLKLERQHMPEGNLIAFGGGSEFNDTDQVYKALDLIRNTVPNMILIHGGQTRGAELIASKWASQNDVDQIIYKPDFKKHQKAAPFKRNDMMIAAKPERVIIFPGNGITKNLAQKAEKARIKVTHFARNP